MRKGTEKADISVTFSLNAPAKNWLAEHEIEADDALILRRVIYADGRSRGFINGTTASIGQLKDLGEYLIDIYSQNAHHSLLKPATQRHILDEFAGNVELAQQVANHYKTWHAYHVKRIEAEQNAAAFADELAELRDKTRELKQLGFVAEDWVELQAEHHRLANGASLLAGLEACIGLLDENEPAVLQMLSQVQNKLSALCWRLTINSKKPPMALILR